MAPKNKGKGGKNRRRGKGGRGDVKRELEFKEDGQEYGQVLKMLGQGRVELQCLDGVKRLGHIRGKMGKRVWIQIGDIVLASLRDFQDEKCDIILKYNVDEARPLKQHKEIPDNIKINETDLMGNEEGFSDDGVEFAEDGSDDEETAGNLLAPPSAAANLIKADIDDI
uniref:Eukaryotic translation initiation factor 4C n=1 Tax=Perkinsus marinus TaxID=31276 RepID=C9VXK7_9ALVE|nr:eukaryotic translation initiation factor 1A [Perkinsus marinus]